MATFGLSGRVALVTGGAQGMGREISERFGREGASVVVGDISEDGGSETVARIIAAGGRAVFRRTDVSKAADVNGLVQLALDTYGDLNHAVNAAAIEGEAPNLRVVSLLRDRSPTPPWPRPRPGCAGLQENLKSSRLSYGEKERGVRSARTFDRYLA